MSWFLSFSSSVVGFSNVTNDANNNATDNASNIATNNATDNTNNIATNNATKNAKQ